MGLFGKKTKYQDTRIISPDGNIEHEELESGNLCFGRSSHFQSWEFDYYQQVIDEKTGQRVQFVSTLNKRPLTIFKHRPTIEGQSTTQLGNQMFDEKMMQIHKQHQSMSMIMWVGIVCLALVIIIGLIIWANM